MAIVGVGLLFKLLSYFVIISRRREVIRLNYGFTNKDLLFLYHHLLKEIKDLEELKKTPGYPFKTDTNKEIRRLRSIADKLAAVHPNLRNMDALFSK